MAKRKLSSEQRAELRAELKKGVDAGEKTPDLLRAVSKKYGITTITARWYLKSIDGAPRAGRRGRKPGRPAGSGPVPGNLARIVEEQHRNAREARRLVPRWQKLVAKQGLLRRQVGRLQRRLDATERRADLLRRRIDVLVKA